MSDLSKKTKAELVVICNEQSEKIEELVAELAAGSIVVGSASGDEELAEMLASALEEIEMKTMKITSLEKEIETLQKSSGSKGRKIVLDVKKKDLITFTVDKAKYQILKNKKVYNGKAWVEAQRLTKEQAAKIIRSGSRSFRRV